MLTITPQALTIPKVATEDISIVAGNIHGEKKAIPCSFDFDTSLSRLPTETFGDPKVCYNFFI